MLLFASQSSLVLPCVEAHKRTFIKLFLLQEFQAGLIRVIWMFCVMGSKWPYSGSFVWCCFQDSFKSARSSYLAFSPCILFESSWCIHMVVLTQTRFGRNCFILPDFHMIDNLLIAIYAFTMPMLRPLSVNKILLPMYVNESTDFKGLALKVEIASCLKHINSIYLRSHRS